MLDRLADQRVLVNDPLPVIASARGTAGEALGRRRDRLAGARGDGVRRPRLASATFGMAPYKTAPVPRAGATWAGAAGEWIGCHLSSPTR